MSQADCFLVFWVECLYLQKFWELGKMRIFLCKYFLERFIGIDRQAYNFIIVCLLEISFAFSQFKLRPYKLITSSLSLVQNCEIPILKAWLLRIFLMVRFAKGMKGTPDEIFEHLFVRRYDPCQYFLCSLRPSLKMRQLQVTYQFTRGQTLRTGYAGIYHFPFQ